MQGLNTGIFPLFTGTLLFAGKKFDRGLRVFQKLRISREKKS